MGSTMLLIGLVILFFSQILNIRTRLAWWMFGIGAMLIFIATWVSLFYFVTGEANRLSALVLIGVLAVVGIILLVIGHWASFNPKYVDTKWPIFLTDGGFVLMVISAVWFARYILPGISL